MDVDLWSKSRPMWMQYWESTPLSGVHLHCTPLFDECTFSVDGWLPKMCRFQNFCPMFIVLHLQSCPHRPKNVKFAFNQKTFKRAFHSCTSESVSALLSDGYVTIHTLCTVSDFMATYREGISLTRHDIETCGSTRELFEDTCVRYWLLHDMASIGWVTIPIICGDRPTPVQTLNLLCIDQHTLPLPFYSTGLAERQYKGWFPTCHMQCMQGLRCRSNNQKTQRTQGPKARYINTLTFTLCRGRLIQV